VRPRAVGGFEPDDRDQHELSELWHTSRTAIALPGPERQALLARHGGERGARLHWVVEQFLREHAGEPNVARKWVYVWSEANLGRHAPGLSEASRAVRGKGSRSSSRRPSARARRSSVIPRADMSWLGPAPSPSSYDPHYLVRDLSSAEMERDIAACSPGAVSRLRKDQRVQIMGDRDNPARPRTLDPIPDGEVASVFEDYGQPYVNVMRDNGQLRVVLRSSARPL
jgi:hypothetical protein